MLIGKIIYVYGKISKAKEYLWASGVGKFPEVPNWREGFGVLKEDIGVWNSQGGGKDKRLRPPPPTFLRLSRIFFPL